MIELLVTIFFVSVGLVGVIAFFNLSIESSTEDKNELIAAGLAQEGVELVRNIVDYNHLNGDDWWRELVVNSVASNSNCKSIDYESLLSHDCITANHTQVCLDNNSRYFQDNSSCHGAVKTSFTRELEISGQDMNGSGIDLNNGDCLKIEVKVSWGDREAKAVDIICKPRE